VAASSKRLAFWAVFSVAVFLGQDIRELLLHELEVAFVVRLLSLETCALVLELQAQLLKHGHDAARLEFVGVRLWSAGLQILLRELNERLDGRPCLGWQLLRLAGLRKGLRDVGLARLQRGDRPLDGTDGLREILVRRRIISVLLLADPGRLLEFRCVGLNVGLEVLDVIGQLLGIRFGLRGGSVQLVDLSAGHLDPLRGLVHRTLAPSCELRESNLLFVLLAFALGYHVAEHLDDLL